MKFTTTPLQGLQLIEPRVHGDTRGSFFECYRKDVFAAHGITDDFVQDNHSSSALGTLRGMHYQAAPAEQAKLVRVVQGAVYDVALDLRTESPTYGKWYAATLSAENRRMLYVPKGFAHGFVVTSDRAEVVYKASAYYAPALERGVAWNDPAFQIEWPDTGCPYTLSDRDRRYLMV